MKQKIINIVGIFFLVIGITLLLYPEIISYLKQKQSDQTVKELTQRRSKRKQDDLLYQKAVRYNRKIFKEKQAGLKDVFSYRSAPIVLRNEKNTFGYIKIPKMKQKLPLYLGATMENMKLKLGYRKVFLNGQEYRGHEFHYSRIIPGQSPLPSIARVTNAKGMEVDTPVYRSGHVTASYIHFYWGDLPPFFI